MLWGGGEKKVGTPEGGGAPGETLVTGSPNRRRTQEGDSGGNPQRNLGEEKGKKRK